MKKVAVIGAGPSGITAVKNFKDRGFDVNFLNFDWWFIQFLTWLMFSLEMRPHCNVVTF